MQASRMGVFQYEERPVSATRHRVMEGGLDHTDLVELLDYTQAQLSKIRQAVAASDHAGTMFAIDCLVGAAAEQTKCKLAGLEHAGMPVGRDASVGGSGTVARFRARAAKPDAGKAATRVRRLP
jgi:hypothetical protein